MPNYGRAFGTGLLVGAAAGVILGVAERYGRRSTPQLIDWNWAVRVALSACGSVPPLSPAERGALEDQYRLVLERIEAPIAAYARTHLPLQGTAVRVLDRPSWIRTNADNFQELLKPFEEFYQERLRVEAAARGARPGGAAVSGLSRLALSGQLGVLLGYLARRVLGQYDISLLGREPVEAGKLYFVEPNIRALEASMNLPPAEIRTWIALHEATHAHEFELHPWVRRYLNSTLQEYLRTMVDELAANKGNRAPFGSLAVRLVENLREGRNLLESLMTPEQRALVSRLQALMALLEGYSNYIMHQVGRGLLPHFAEIEARIEARQKQRSPIEVWFLRITGLSMKMEQYVLGEAFVRHVVETCVIDFLNRFCSGPEALPSAAELRAPATWVTRLEAAA
jgi:coenzyme F420 biosynthesis associated uncharacterized protein